MNFETIFEAADNSKPSKAQLAEWEKRDEENKRYNSYDYTHPDKKPRTALTGWDGRTLCVDEVQWSPGYAEAGYSDTDKGILFANWNHVSRRVQDLLERAGYAIEWEDEWNTCEDCGKAVRMSADSYSWQPSYVLLDECSIVCNDCLNGHASEYLESLEDDHRTALNNRSIDPSEHGYTLHDEQFENGWYDGQNDNPKAIYERLKTSENHVLFEINSVGQFDIHFRAWTR